MIKPSSGRWEGSANRSGLSGKVFRLGAYRLRGSAVGCLVVLGFPVVVFVGVTAALRFLGLPWVLALPIAFIAAISPFWFLGGPGASSPAVPPGTSPYLIIEKDEPRNVSELLAETIRQLPQGRIVFNPATKMQVGTTERVEARVSRTLTQDITVGLKGRGVPMIEAIKVGPEMAAKLTGASFDINALSDADQLVTAEEYTEWAWDVRPLRSGNQTLSLLLAVRVRIDSTDARRDYPVFDRVIKVRVNAGYSATRFVSAHWKGFLAGLAGTGVIGVLVDHFLGGSKK